MPTFMRHPGGVSALCLCLMTPTLGLAEADWQIGLEGGTVIRDGESLSRVRARASLNERPLSHYLYAEWYPDADNALEFGYRPDYWLTPQLYTFAEARLRLEEEIGIDRETRLLAGAGWQLLASRDTRVRIEAGAGVQQSVFVEQTGLDDESTGLGVLRSSGDHLTGDLFRLDYLASVFAASGNVQSELEVGASVRMPRGALRLSYRVRRVDVDGLPTVDDSDTALSFTVGF